MIQIMSLLEAVRILRDILLLEVYNFIYLYTYDMVDNLLIF